MGLPMCLNENQHTRGSPGPSLETTAQEDDRKLLCFSNRREFAKCLNQSGTLQTDSCLSLLFHRLAALQARLGHTVSQIYPPITEAANRKCASLLDTILGAAGQ